MSGTTELSVPQTMRLEEAPPADPPVDTPAAEPERPRNPREEMMRTIAARYEEQQRGHEIAYGEQLDIEARARYTAEHPDEAPEPPPASPVEPAQEPAPGEPPAAPVEPLASAAPAPRTVTIQGQQFQVTEEQFARLAEMGALANAALAQQQYQAPPQHQQGRQETAPQSPPQARQPAIDREQAAAIHQRLAYGGQDDGIAAIQELASNLAERMAAQQPRINPAQIQHQATAAALQHIQLNNDLAAIGQEYPEIFGNHTLSRAAAIELTDIRQRDALLGRQRSNLDLYREACGIVRSALGTSAQQSQSGAETPPALQAAPSPERLERKRAAPRNPAAISRAAGLGPEAPRPPTAAEIVNQMKRARGQLPLN